jgi:hypothetical protein
VFRLLPHRAAVCQFVSPCTKVRQFRLLPQRGAVALPISPATTPPPAVFWFSSVARVARSVFLLHCIPASFSVDSGKHHPTGPDQPSPVAAVVGSRVLRLSTGSIS